MYTVLFPIRLYKIVKLAALPVFSHYVCMKTLCHELSRIQLYKFATIANISVLPRSCEWCQTQALFYTKSWWGDGTSNVL